ncbi:hypothetical protein CBS101457_003886 [Exobasidium rhododendri]|nr:hypothetical protein CBS101457_003886 [Exobasidium rhododendri]
MTSNEGKGGSSLSRLAAIGKQLLPANPFTTRAADNEREQLGTLRMGSTVELPVYAPKDITRLPDERLLLSLEDTTTLESLEWMAKKYALGQDMFLLSQPGSYARRLALTFAALLQLPVEHVALHRDIGEAELLQTRNLEKGGNLSYTDGPVVRAMKTGGILILEGVERAERNVLPLLNNILENREQDLPDGTSLVPASRLHAAQMEEAVKTGHKASNTSRFQAVDPNFKVIALGLPTPPYKGNPLDPPFRSRFQARWVEGIVPSSLGEAPILDEASQQLASLLKQRIFEWAALLRLHATAARGADVLPPASQLPNVPASALSLLDDLISRFPPIETLAAPPTITISEEEGKLGTQQVRMRDGALSVPERSRDQIQQREAESLKKLQERSDKPGVDARVAASTDSIVGAGYPMMHTLDATKKRLATELLWSVGLDKGVGISSEEIDGRGLMGYKVAEIERVSVRTAKVTFDQVDGGLTRSVVVPCGPLAFIPLPVINSEQAQVTGDVLVTPRLYSILTSMLQLHALGRDICLLPSALISSSEEMNVNTMQASSSTSTSIGLFAGLLGYQVESLWLHKDVGGTELVMRRGTSPDGSTIWEAAPLLKGATEARIVHLAGIDVLGPTLASLARLTQDRELELWAGGRAALGGGRHPEIEGKEVGLGRLTTIHPSFRIIATANGSRSDWLNEETSTLFGFVQPSPMSSLEERQVLETRTSCPGAHLDKLLDFTARYRSLSKDVSLGLSKSRRLGTRALIRMAKRLAKFPDSTDLHALLSRNLLVEFLPRTTKELIKRVLDDSGLHPRGAEGAFEYRPQEWLADPVVDENVVQFHDLNAPDLDPVVVQRYPTDRLDPDGKHLIPALGRSFFNNNTQSILLRDLAIDLQVMEEHVLLLGAQGVGKNKIIDRIVELLDRPREYMQLHRDSTVAQILQLVELKGGQLKFLESPLVRAIRTGRVAVIDEADKCSAAVTAVFKSLAERSELSLPDGRRVRPANSFGSPDDVIVHPDFRLVLLANRPGFPFLGNSFLEVLGEGFSCYAVGNPDLASEVRLLQQAAPSVEEGLIRNLDLAFHDLRDAFDAGLITYPYSLRELLHIVRHLHHFPSESLTEVLLNTLSFDLHRPESINLVYDTLRKRGLNVQRLSLAAIRERAEEKMKEGPGRIEWDPKKLGKDTFLSGPKEGKVDPENKEHSGGNTWKGGTGGRDTAGLGGRGGYERFYSGQQIKQINTELKKDVPDHIKEQARVMAQKALLEKLADQGMTTHEGATYQKYKQEVTPQIQHLVNILNDLQANAKERNWLTRQQEGELDERRLTNALTGERAVFKRRQENPPEVGAPQTKPKRIRFLVDLSASMYSMQYDGRLDREIKTMLMIMEAFSHVSKERFLYDIVGHHGESAHVAMTTMDKPPQSIGERWKVLRDSDATMTYVMSGDSSLEAIQWACKDITRTEADDYFVIALSDANLSRYGITAENLEKAMKTSEKVKVALICLDRGDEGKELARRLPGKAFQVSEMKSLPQVLSSILTTMLEN